MPSTNPRHRLLGGGLFNGILKATWPNVRAGLLAKAVYQSCMYWVTLRLCEQARSDILSIVCLERRWGGKWAQIYLHRRSIIWRLWILETRGIQKITYKKVLGLSTCGFFVCIWSRRRLNWAVICPYSLGVFGGASVRHTCGHTRRFRLATFFEVSRRVKQHQMVADVLPSGLVVTSSFDLLLPVRRAQG